MNKHNFKPGFMAMTNMINGNNQSAAKNVETEDYFDDAIDEKIAKTSIEASEFYEDFKNSVENGHYIEINYPKRSLSYDATQEIKYGNIMEMILEDAKANLHQTCYLQNHKVDVDIPAGLLFQADLSYGYGREPQRKCDCIALLPAPMNKPEVVIIPFRFAISADEKMPRDVYEQSIGNLAGYDNIELFVNVHYIRTIHKVRIHRKTVGYRKKLFSPTESLMLTDKQIIKVLDIFFDYLKKGKLLIADQIKSR